jgi:hypothetical protein
MERIRTLLREHPVTVFIGVGIGVIAIVMAINALVLSLSGRSESQMPNPTTTTSSSGAANKPSPTNSIPQTEEASESSTYKDSYVETDCAVVMNSDDYSQLLLRILNYEEARLQPDFNTNEIELRTFGTEKYTADHIGVGSHNQSENGTVVTVDRQETVVNCNVASSDRAIVQTTITATTSNASSTVNSSFVLPVHFTGWIKINNVWFVDSEQR